jgi:hypothetical protein
VCDISEYVIHRTTPRLSIIRRAKSSPEPPADDNKFNTPCTIYVPEIGIDTTPAPLIVIPEEATVLKNPDPNALEYAPTVPTRVEVVVTTPPVFPREAAAFPVAKTLKKAAELAPTAPVGPVLPV